MITALYERKCVICSKIFNLPKRLREDGFTVISDRKTCGFLCGKKLVVMNKMNSKNVKWSDENRSLHRWVRNRVLKPEFCVSCKLSPPRDLANISQKYLRDLNDWEWLCRKCHMKKDGRLYKLIKRNINAKI